ncbi:HsdM family class I SAM-dependent methyltransferase [Dyadobacter arcticus]|uniref:site-specific DNA-methyltransferase (adenine-specific) n=1 Tax=Dyadobacter arcticus TaxID=1078754 RepID=A0ABX0ULY2_9BACT|nr:N-6 DNA methylase [Dyadobacter arcticus]NIJ54017.1 SAM-dependent methyltransferase [Dyadobacter arcticus]
MNSLQIQVFQEKKLFGRVYTPDYIVTKILDDIEFSGLVPEKTIVDPACGDGQFLKQIVERILANTRPSRLKEALENVYGWDIDKEAVQKCRILLNRLIKQYDVHVEWNISVGNSLDHLLHHRFDYVVGNPPYIRIQNLAPEVRQFLKINYDFCVKGSTDIYIAFFELASRLLTDQGKCGYITPNSYFVSDNAYLLRLYFETKRNLLQITNFKDELIFGDASTYSAITIFDARPHENFLYQEFNGHSYLGKRIAFNHLNGRKFWFLTLSNKFLEVKIGQRLGDICQISVGIATLADWAYIVKIIGKPEPTIIKVQNKHGNIFSIEKDILKPIIKASRLKPSDNSISEYIIYPYQKNQNNRTEIIPEDIFKARFPFSYTYLTSIRTLLDQRDKKKPNPVAWYAFGRSQSMDTSIGEKIVFSPMKKKPNFIISKNPEALVYSGYYIKYAGNFEWLVEILNSVEMEDYINVTGRYFGHGWRGLTKRILEDFIIPL